MEFWTLGGPAARTVAQTAARAEAVGFDGFAVVNTQNLAGDPYVALTLAAGVTERIGLGTAMTNPVTRHPAATAAAVASVHEASGGRATLGIGRGDSSLSHLGRGPASVAVLEHYLTVLQGYLRGDEVPFETLRMLPVAPAKPAESAAAVGAPVASRILWLDAGLPKVPVEVPASGPRVLAVAARHADRVMLAVGAEPDRLAWAAEVVRTARRAAGLAEDGVALGAYVHVGCYPDLDVARSLVHGGLSTVARYAVSGDDIHGPLEEGDREVLADVRRRSAQTPGAAGLPGLAGALTPEFVDRFAIVGPPERCVERLRDVLAIGFDKLLINGGGLPDPGVTSEAGRLLAGEVLPALRDRPTP